MGDVKTFHLEIIFFAFEGRIKRNWGRRRWAREEESLFKK